MFKMKRHALIFILILTNLAACSQGEENTIENEITNELEVDSEVVTDTETGTKEEVATMFQHVHGLAYELSEPYDLYLGTHQGVFHINPENHWTWLGTKKHRHDVMGFNFIDEDIMISSGHPSEASNFENPIGIILSTDKAESWEPIALHGEVDFHLFEVNASDSGVLYGIDVSGFYRSEDSGYTWEVIETKGLPENTQDIFSLISNPGQAHSLLAGTKYGILKSENGGETWELATDQETMISAKGAYKQAETIVAYVQGKNQNGLMKSEDFGNTWTSLNLTLDKDAVAHIAIHPNNREEYTVGTFNGNMYRTKDSGDNWVMIAEKSKSIVD
ncbi:F510_1955 family glycosylhydrolase [Bacillus solitudinis]|uniref:F510_1955 family glycosylhydrolase n=1 Tax=Bacillus solitudinis TaxID=2014074 RepID=UPI000C231CAE|nr:YCF48-related protein [Bacillus solitudinis]